MVAKRLMFGGVMITGTRIERAWPAMPYTLYTVYTPIGGKGRCRTSCDLQDHSTQARKSAGKRSTLALKPMRKDT